MRNEIGTQVRQAIKIIRQAHFARSDPRPNPREPVIYWEETCLNGRPYMVPLIILRTRPCRWFSSGGCTMCNYELLAIDEGVSDQDVLAQADCAISKLGDMTRYPYLLLTSQGSFLDDEEINPSLRAQLLVKFWQAGLRAISTESEARYCINVDRILAMKHAFPGRISVGIGFEAADEFVRNSIINKGLPMHMLARAADVLKERGCHFYTYISLGKPFLTWDEDVDDAVLAIRQSIELGVFMCVVEMINVQPHTLTERLWRAAIYKPCNTRRGLDVLTRLAEEEREFISIKGFDADVSLVPLALPASCDACDERVRHALNDWNLHRNYSSLHARAGDCECHTQKEGDDRLIAFTLADRVKRGIAAINPSSSTSA